MKFPKLLVVIHETVVDCPTLLTHIQSPNFGASYHTCIDRQGNVIYLVPSHKKAYAAARSQFLNPDTGEVESIDNSVDDFAYHIALESPTDGTEGYTQAQYKSLAWVISKTGVADNWITTHAEVSLSGSDDPQGFEYGRLYTYLSNLKRERVFEFGALE